MDFGTILINVGYTLNVIALAFREILWIRVLLTSAYLLRFLTQYLYENNQNLIIKLFLKNINLYFSLLCYSFLKKELSMYLIRLYLLLMS